MHLPGSSGAPERAVGAAEVCPSLPDPRTSPSSRSSLSRAGARVWFMVSRSGRLERGARRAWRTSCGPALTTLRAPASVLGDPSVDRGWHTAPGWVEGAPKPALAVRGFGARALLASLRHGDPMEALPLVRNAQPLLWVRDPSYTGLGPVSLVRPRFPPPRNGMKMIFVWVGRLRGACVCSKRLQILASSRGELARFIRRASQLSPAAASSRYASGGGLLSGAVWEWGADLCVGVKRPHSHPRPLSLPVKWRFLFSFFPLPTALFLV